VVQPAAVVVSEGYKRGIISVKKVRDGLFEERSRKMEVKQ
jgi:hypothetical protein